jgi:hypothetical protein
MAMRIRMKTVFAIAVLTALSSVAHAQQGFTSKIPNDRVQTGRIELNPYAPKAAPQPKAPPKPPAAPKPAAAKKPAAPK